MEDIGWSPDHLALLEELLASKHTTFKDSDQWTGTPRICDITATYLLGDDLWDRDSKFPRQGLDAEKDQAIEEIKNRLHETPGSLHIPRMTYWEDRTLGDSRKTASKPD